MIFRVLVNIAFAFLGPLGAATLLIGDWLLNAFIVVKVVENVVPNGPAIVGNVSEMVPILMNAVYSAAMPVLMANYTGMANDIMNVTKPIFLEEWFNSTTVLA